MTEPNRILTLQIEITDPHRAKWIWENHLDNLSQYGVRVQAIHEGTIEDQYIETP